MNSSAVQGFLFQNVLIMDYSLLIIFSLVNFHKISIAEIKIRLRILQ